MELEELYDRIYRYCYFHIGRKELAEDLTQETFLRFFTGILLCIRRNSLLICIPLRKISVRMLIGKKERNCRERIWKVG